MNDSGILGPGSALILTGMLLGLAVLVAARGMERHRDLGTPADRATFATLHTASQAAPHLRDGLTPAGATKAAKHLRTLLGTAAVAITDATATLAWDGLGVTHTAAAIDHAAAVLRTGRTAVLDAGDIACADFDCPIRSVVVAPLVAEQRVIGTLLAYGRDTSAGLVRAAEEVAGWVSAQLQLAELDRSRTRAIEAELRALRAQISPHFIYNSLAAIASFVRTDPERARELLLEFADFTRYAFRRGGEFATLAEELRNVERYLVLEQARFGERIQVHLMIAPEVLSVSVPYLAVQPLVENAVRHGLEGKDGVGTMTIKAEDVGTEALISVEDDGVGADPEVMRQVLAGRPRGDSVGLGNVDARLRQVFGEDHGLVVETAPGAGTKVSFRAPKFSPHVTSR